MKNKERIAVTTFHNGFAPNDIGGVSSAPIYLADQLRNYYDEVDLISLRDTKNYKSLIASEVKFVSDPEILDEYDFVLFTTPGLTYEKYDERTPNKYIDILNHAKKFTFIFNEENDRKMYPYHMNFVNHPNLSFITFNCPGMADIFSDYREICPTWNYVSFSPILPEKSFVLERAKNKKNKIMSTCRWTTSKRIYEYLSMSNEFKDRGIEVYAAGAHQSYWYNLKMAELPEDSYIDLGYFEPSQLPELLSDVKYHWNFLFQVKSMGLRTHQPRLEIATMEAIREGCLPVLCSEFTPEWLGYESAIRLSKNNYEDIPEILYNLAEDERLKRISSLYDLVQKNVIEHYKEYVETIQKSISCPSESF